MQRSKELLNQLENLLVEVIVAYRDAFLRAKKGRPPMNYWTYMQDRLRSSARTSSTAAEFLTTYQRKLQLEAASNWDSSVMMKLAKLCDENDLDIEMMEFVDREHGFLIAMARQIVDERKTKREAGDVSLNREALEETAKKYGLMEETA